MAQASASSNKKFKEVNAITTRSDQNMVIPSMTTWMLVSNASMPSNITVNVPFPKTLKSTRKVLKNQGEILILLRK